MMKALITLLTLCLLSNSVISQDITKKTDIFNRNDNVITAYKVYNNNELKDIYLIWFAQNYEYKVLIQSLIVSHGSASELLETVDYMINFIRDNEKDTSVKYKNLDIDVYYMAGTKGALVFFDGGFHNFRLRLLERIKTSIVDWMGKDPDLKDFKK